MWSFSGATSCTKSGSDEWTGTLSIPSGSQIIKPKTATTYKLTCTNPAGSIIKSVTVNIAGGGIITPPLPTAICGNGIKEGSEACDDKNIVNDDGCSTTCQIETGWTCNGQPSVCILTSQCLNIKLCSDYTNSTKCKADVCSVGDKSAPSSIDCTATNIKCGCLWKSNLNTCGFSYSSISSPNAILISLLLTKQEFSTTEKITLK